MKRTPILVFSVLLSAFSLSRAAVQVTINSVVQQDSLITVTFGLNNDVAVAGLQFDLVDEPNAFVLNPTSVTAVGRLASVAMLTIVGQEVDTAASRTRYLWFSMSGATVAAGNDDHITATFAKVLPGAQAINLRVTAVYPSDAMGNNLDGSGDTFLFNMSSATEGENQVPATFALQQNYPNPFNPTTDIRYAVPNPSWVTLNVYDLRGNYIRNLVSVNHSAGYFTATWDGKDYNGMEVASGAYIYRLETQGRTIAKKMMLMR